MSENNHAHTGVAQHYAREDLADSVLAALGAAGLSRDGLRPQDLAPLDQFHARGLPGTLDLARRAGLRAGQRVLDIGGGLGGAARVLAAEFGCTVEVLDLTEAFCRAGEALTRQCGLAERVSFRPGDALDLPYPDHSFDAVWTQHSTMNIADKPRLYAGLHRVLKPGGRLAMHEIMAGPAVPIYLPVPWARQAQHSHLLQQAEMQSAITQAGFRCVLWEDESAESLAFFRQRFGSPPPASPPPLGLHLLLGADLRPMFDNTIRNLEEQRITVAQAVFEA